MDLRGLTEAQVIKSREKYGTNQMPRPKLKTGWQFFIEVFQDKLNLILLLMMFIFIGLGISGYGSVSEAIGIGIVLIVVATTTVWTKIKTQRGAEELRIRSSQLFANVVRDGMPKTSGTLKAFARRPSGSESKTKFNPSFLWKRI